MITADNVTDDLIVALRAEARAVRASCRDAGEDVGDLDERIRACSAALGLRISDGALGTLDQRACRERVAKIIANEGTARHYGLLTAATITDEQIRELLIQCERGRAFYSYPFTDRHTWETCHLALGMNYNGTGRAPAGLNAQTAARARCAEIINKLATSRPDADAGQRALEAATAQLADRVLEVKQR